MIMYYHKNILYKRKGKWKILYMLNKNANIFKAEDIALFRKQVGNEASKPIPEYGLK